MTILMRYSFSLTKYSAANIPTLSGAPPFMFASVEKNIITDVLVIAKLLAFMWLHFGQRIRYDVPAAKRKSPSLRPQMHRSGRSGGIRGSLLAVIIFLFLPKSWRVICRASQISGQSWQATCQQWFALSTNSRPRASLVYHLR